MEISFFAFLSKLFLHISSPFLNEKKKNKKEPTLNIFVPSKFVQTRLVIFIPSFDSPEYFSSRRFICCRTLLFFPLPPSSAFATTLPAVVTIKFRDQPALVSRCLDACLGRPPFLSTNAVPFPPLLAATEAPFC